MKYTKENSKIISLRLTNEEYEKVKSFAKGGEISSYLRKKALNEDVINILETQLIFSESDKERMFTYLDDIWELVEKINKPQKPATTGTKIEYDTEEKRREKWLRFVLPTIRVEDGDYGTDHMGGKYLKYSSSEGVVSITHEDWRFEHIMRLKPQS